MRRFNIVALILATAGSALPAQAGTPKVLYDQTAGFTGFGITTATYLTPSYMQPYNSEGAEDFVALDTAGWTITGFRFTSFGGNNPSEPPPGTARVAIYMDSGLGAPAASPVCAPEEVPVAFDPGSQLASVTLNDPCVLVQARHWVGLSFVTDRDGGDDINLAGAWGVVGGSFDRPAVWRNPPAGSASGCNDWGTLEVCGRGQHGSAFGFQVLGFPNDDGMPIAPTVNQAFAPAILPAGGSSRLTVTLGNPNETVANLVADFVDVLPAGLVVAAVPDAQTTCAVGTVTATAGSDSVRLSAGAQLPPFGNCTVAVSVSAPGPGRFVHTIPTDALQTDLGNNLVSSIGVVNVYGDSSGDIGLVVTIGTEPPPACGTAVSMNVPLGTPVNFCFTMTNNTAETLDYHTLGFAPRTWFYATDSDTHLFHLKHRPVPAGESFQYNHVIVANAAQLPSFTWTAFAGEPTYIIDETAQPAYVDLSSLGTPLNLVAASAYLQDLPFPFAHYGFTYRSAADFKLCLFNSGAVQFVKNGCPVFGGFYDDNSNDLSPDQNSSLLPFWDFLGDNGQVYQATLGTAPERRFIVEWQQKPHYAHPDVGDGVTFELVLDEATGTISYLYRDATFGVAGLDGGASATIGMSDITRVLGQQYSHNQASVADGHSIVWRPMYPARFADAQARINVGSARIVVHPESLTAAVDAGAGTSRTLHINNLGDVALRWSLDDVEPDAHFPAVRADIGRPAAVVLDHPSEEPVRELQDEFDRYAIQSAAGALNVPAYALKIEAAPSTDYRFVAFDASAPAQFGILPYPGDSHRVGDFIGDDFSRLYAIMGDPVSPSTAYLATIDTATAALSVIAANVVPQIPEIQWAGMSWDRTTDTAYAVAWTHADFSACSVGGHGSGLYAIDPSSGAVARVGSIEVPETPVCISDVAVAPNGLIYGIDAYNDALVAIDKSTGEAAFIGLIGFDLVQKNTIDFDDASGVLYLAAYQQGNDPAGEGGMYTINLETGAAQRIAPFPVQNAGSNFVGLAALSIAKPGGDCAAPGDVPWLVFGPTGGAVAGGGTENVGVTLDAGGLVPGTYEADICIHSNDRSRPMVTVPIQLDVADPDAIFVDGFESAPNP